MKVSHQNLGQRVLSSFDPHRQVDSHINEDQQLQDVRNVISYSPQLAGSSLRRSVLSSEEVRVSTRSSMRPRRSSLPPNANGNLFVGCQSGPTAADRRNIDSLEGVDATTVTATSSQIKTAQPIDGASTKQSEDTYQQRDSPTISQRPWEGSPEAVVYPTRPSMPMPDRRRSAFLPHGFGAPRLASSAPRRSLKGSLNPAFQEDVPEEPTCNIPTRASLPAPRRKSMFPLGGTSVTVAGGAGPAGRVVYVGLSGTAEGSAPTRASMPTRRLSMLRPAKVAADGPRKASRTPRPPSARASAA